jgi:hypothetical protein
LAADISADNDTTGYNSDNNAVVDVNNSTDVNIQNKAEINNNINLGANTGNNSSSYNTGNGSVDTGSIDVAGEVNNQANGIEISGSGDNITGNIEVSNNTTGAESQNTAGTKIDNNFDLNVSNGMDVNNLIATHLNTGGNDASYNTGNGKVSTGNIGQNVKVTTAGNMIIIDWGDGHSSSIDISAINSTTGYDSQNDAIVALKNDLEIALKNWAEISNKICLGENTGDNTASYNTGNGKVSTGDANSDLELVIKANTIELETDGSPSGSVDFSGSNDQTGAKSNNTASGEFNFNLDLAILNSADISNKVKSDVSTGSNEASYNTGQGQVDTGDAETNIEIGSGTQINTIGLSVGGGSPGNIDVEASNSHTGYSSDNDAVANIESDFDLAIKNCLDVDNEVDAHVNTGDNEASYNTGDPSVDSGDAEVNVSTDVSGNLIEVDLAGAYGDISADLSNDTTGAESDNNALAIIDKDVEIDLANRAHINNEVNTCVNTGDNEASYNTGAGEVTSGDATVNIDGLHTDVNVIKIDFGSGAGDINVSAENSKTGYSSDNDAVAVIESDFNLDVDNCLGVENDVRTHVNTGDNEASYNTGDGIVDSGDASVSTDLTTHGNLIEVDLGLPLAANIDINLSNDTTGAESSNSAIAELDNDVDLDLNQEARISNEVDACVNTGDNEASYNTGDGEVTSGDAAIEINFETVANEIEINGMDEIGSSIDITLSNEKTGYDSENNACVKIDNKIEVDVDNHASINNNADVKANTGDNEASYNTGDGTVDSGDIDVAFGFINQANVIGMAPMTAGLDLSVEASNNTTGAESDNDTSVNIDNNTESNLDNCGSANNNIEGDLETGDSEGSYNTGSGEIDSGQVSVEKDFDTVLNMVGSSHIDWPECDQCGDTDDGDLQIDLDWHEHLIQSILEDLEIDIHQK